jgi:hypothetical protein
MKRGVFFFLYFQKYVLCMNRQKWLKDKVALRTDGGLEVQSITPKTFL